ncbi:unnamed protein product [Gongylonema pulchrum]|uniref:Succinate dehydrogenase assembly factor 2, mitochondrial n=1 Tax=Gongylonema pulchrum TaxID=637853 RepID=A0A183E804_9BILA|nr:unnamed protein product [Gongylonema pulchrum]
MNRPCSKLLSAARQLLSARHPFLRAVAQCSESKQPQTAHEYRADSRAEQEDLKTKRSRLLYQSKKRGILENDIILGEFADEMLEKMDREQLMRYDEIINGEHMEWDLYYFISGKKPLPKDLENCKVMHVDTVLVTICSSFIPAFAIQTNPVSIPKGQKHGNIVIAAVISTPLLPDSDSFGVCELEGFDLNPTGPLVPCSFLDERWIDCDAPVDASSIPSANNTKVILMTVFHCLFVRLFAH